MDFTQDLDNENLKVTKKTRGKRLDDMDDVEEYFNKPVHAKGQVCLSIQFVCSHFKFHIPFC
jgi:hypothetical protein